MFHEISFNHGVLQLASTIFKNKVLEARINKYKILTKSQRIKKQKLLQNVYTKIWNSNLAEATLQTMLHPQVKIS